MRLSFRAALAIAVLPATAALAHDFWMQPQGYRFPAPAAVPFSILVGHGAARQPWAVDRERVRMLRSYGPDGVRDQRGSLAQQPGGGAGILRLAAPGTYMVAFESTPVTSRLPGPRFNDYATEEGLTPALAARRARGKMGDEGRELYSRRTKMLVVAGAPSAPGRSVATRRIGLTLEIVPERDPATLAPDEPLPVRIFYHNAPLPGALVKLTNLDFDAKPLAARRTDAAGRTIFQVPRVGGWLLNVIWTRPIAGNAAADFDTVFSSLCFGYRPGRNAAG